MGALLCSLGAATWAYLPPAAPPRRAGFSDSARPLRRWNSASLSPRASPRNSPPLKPRGENISLSPPPWTRKKPCAGTSRQTVNCEDSPPALHQAVAGGQRRRPARSAPGSAPQQEMPKRAALQHTCACSRFWMLPCSSGFRGGETERQSLSIHPSRQCLLIACYGHIALPQARLNGQWSPWCERGWARSSWPQCSAVCPVHCNGHPSKGSENACQVNFI